MDKDFDDLICDWIDDYGGQMNFVMEKLYNIERADDITPKIVESFIYDCLSCGLRELFGRAMLFSDMGDFNKEAKE